MDTCGIKTLCSHRLFIALFYFLFFLGNQLLLDERILSFEITPNKNSINKNQVKWV